jgi:two-component system cell cycle response regulator DivK
VPKILVVEDDPQNVDIMVEFLEMHGHEAIVTGDGEQAIEIALSQAPALVLMDATLEGSAIDGWEASKKLKADPRTRSIPIIAVTASVMASDKERAESAGCDDFAAKPFKFKELIAKIDALLTA